MSFDLRHELARKMIHLTSILIVIIFLTFGKNIILQLLTIELIILLVIEFFRIEHNKTIPIVHRLFRHKETHTLGGHVFFVIGAIIAISVFNQNVAAAAILMTTFGDTAAAIIGKAFGKTWIKGLKNRAVEGCMAEFVTNCIIGYILLNSWYVILAMAATATIVETLVDKMDDNLVIPVFAGACGEVILFISNTFG